MRGPGTGTSDDIPLTLNTGGEGMNINVSNGEGLAVLPAADHAQPRGGRSRERHHRDDERAPPRGLKAGASYADGSAPYKLGSDPELEQKRMVDAGTGVSTALVSARRSGNSLALYRRTFERPRTA